MIEQLPTAPTPKWLENISQKMMTDAPFPLVDVLKDSLYYPSSGFDGDPVKHLGGNILSFVYVNYSNSEEEAENALNNPGFLGYKVIASRSVSKDELTPNGWTPKPLRPSDGNPARYRNQIQQPFCTWSVLERDADILDSHGPKRFSHLYLCADGSAAYDAIYNTNSIVPKAVAIIQPSHGSGLNWTDYTKPGLIFERTVMGNEQGQPELLLYGGIGKREYYKNPCWPQFAKNVCFLSKECGGGIGVWQK